MNNEPELSIVIVNSDGLQDTLNCLKSIELHAASLYYEIIVVDNNSVDRQAQAIQEQYPQVRVLHGDRRQGFSRNYNLGIRTARANLILILNNDTMVKAGSLQSILAFATENPGFGMYGPKILQKDGCIQTTCARKLLTPGGYIAIQLFLDPGFPAGKLADSFRRHRISQMAAGAVPCISGAAMMVRRNAAEQAGLLDEGFEFYFEDAEWCHRFQKHGFKVAYVPQAEIIHLGDQSLSKVREWAKQCEYRSALRYFSRYNPFPTWQQWAVWLAALAGYLIRATGLKFVGTLSGKESFASAYWRLASWILQLRPDLIRQEEQIEKNYGA